MGYQSMEGKCHEDEGLELEKLKSLLNYVEECWLRTATDD